MYVPASPTLLLIVLVLPLQLKFSLVGYEFPLARRVIRGFIYFLFFYLYFLHFYPFYLLPLFYLVYFFITAYFYLLSIASLGS